MKGLGISWLDGELNVWFNDGTGAPKTWRCPDEITNIPALTAAIGEAKRCLGFKSPPARLVLDKRNVLFHVIELPPAKGRILHQLLARQVDNCRFFDTAATWSHLPIPSSNPKRRFLLALTTNSQIEEITGAFESNGIRLSGIHPVASVLAPRLRMLGLATEEPALIVVNHAGSNNMIVGFGSGELIFARNVGPGDQSPGERLEQETTRTLHFIRQQFGITVSRIFLPESQRNELQVRNPANGIKPESLPWELGQDTFAAWMVEAGKQPIFNLKVSSPTGGFWLEPCISAGVVAALAGSIVFASLTEQKFRARQAAFDRLSREAEAEASAEALRVTRQAEGLKLNALLQTIPAPNTRSVADLFPRYIASTLPSSMRLTRLDVARSNRGWEIHVEGLCQDAGSGFIQKIEEFEKSMREGAFKVRLTDSTSRRTTTTSATTPGRSSSARSRTAPEQTERPFFFAGVIQ